MNESWFVVAEEGLALRQMVETDKGVFAEGMAATEDKAVHAAVVETGEGTAAVIAAASIADESTGKSSEESVEKAGDESTEAQIC